MRKSLYFLITILLVGAVYAEDTSQTFLSLKNTGVEAFRTAHPEYDGRGTIVLILDTGVDMGVDGLITTTTGERKVIDVQDFTGQGDTPFFIAEIDEQNGKEIFINEKKNFKVAGANKLKLNSMNDKYFIGVLKESLWKNSGSHAGDINGNGTKDDLFFFVTFQVNKNGRSYWVVFIDTNNNGDISDEKPLRNYKENYDSFTIPNKSGLAKFTLGLNIFPELRKVSFFFDDGSHGTHCAGISTGNRIGNTDFYGVAPGAKVIGLKIGNNNYSGGATVAQSMQKAYLYADKISKERNEPCIINMSFGVGSEIEGNADIELFLADLVKKNPYLYISTSNGNEGPGLSTCGMPSASCSIFSTGAVLAKEVGNDLYGTTLNKDIILHFSSRGGEVKKPDVVAPGACVSTVPNFSKGDRMWGTSMASPYSAGVMSVLLGAVKVEYPDIKIPSQLIYKVLRESAKPMEGYDFVDQGNGLINISAAYTLLKKYIDNGEINNFETYTLESLAPNMPNSTAPSLYIRDASFLSGSEKFSFKIKRNNFNKTNKFYRIYNLNSDADWLKVIQKRIHIRNDQSVTVNAKLDKKILATPGLYNTRINAVRADNSKFPEFELMTTVIVPYEFNSKNHYSLSFENEKVDPGMLKRFFLKIPFGASNIKITVSSFKNEYTSVRYYLHNPDGEKKLYGSFDDEFDYGNKVDYVQDLTPGVYEFVILGQYTSEQESTFDLNFEIDGINFIGNSVKKDGNVKIVNYFSNAKIYKLGGNLLGFQKFYKVNTNGKKMYEIPFELKKGEAKKRFEISLSKEVFNKETDFALMIYDKDGIAKSSSGLSYKDGSIEIKRQDNNKVENYKLVMIPGFANEPINIEIGITEKSYFSNPYNLTVESDKKNTLKMYPDINYLLNCKCDKPDLKVPDGYSYFGGITFTSNKTDEVEFTKIININM